MIFAFPVMLFLLVIWVLTLLAWIEGMRATAGAGEGKAAIRRRILPQPIQPGHAAESNMRVLPGSGLFSP
jgi:hypothetical protein